MSQKWHIITSAKDGYKKCVHINSGKWTLKYRSAGMQDRSNLLSSVIESEKKDLNISTEKFTQPTDEVTNRFVTTWILWKQ